MAESTDWILKILSGPHQGAEVTLRPGRVLLGSDPDCDVVLHDLLIAPRHLALELADGKLSLEPLDGPAFIAGHRARATMPVPAFTFITAGTTHLIAGPSSARWPLISAADAPELEKEPPSTEPAAEAETTPANAPQNASTAPSATGRALPTREQRRRAWWSAGFGGALLLVWLTLWWTWSPTPKPPPATTDARTRAEAVLARFPDATGVTLGTEGERLTASGYIETESLHRQLTSAFREEAPEVNLRIWNLPRLLSAAQSILRQRQPGINASVTASGILSLRGTAPSAAAWSETRSLLLAEVPGLAGIDDNELIFASSPRPVAEPLPAPQPEPAPAQPPAHLSVIALHSLGLGQGWVRLSDGRVFFRGGRLDSFGTVTAVDERHAVLENDGGRFELRIGQTLRSALEQPRPLTADSAPAPVLAHNEIPQTGENSGDRVQAD